MKRISEHNWYNLIKLSYNQSWKFGYRNTDIKNEDRTISYYIISNDNTLGGL